MCACAQSVLSVVEQHDYQSASVFAPRDQRSLSNYKSKQSAVKFTIYLAKIVDNGGEMSEERN